MVTAPFTVPYTVPTLELTNLSVAVSIGKYGRPGGIRTPDQSVMSGLL